MAGCAGCRGGSPRPDLAAILSRYAPPPERLNPSRARVLRAITSCRTAALGGHLQVCSHCGRETRMYNSCRDRHCPRCQNLAQARWVEAQTRHLLPVPYFHLVFTVPDSLQPLFLRDPRQTYKLLFDAVAETLGDVCRRRLGATPGFIAVLHTWTQKLLFHPHIHCIVTGGGLSGDGQRWITSKPRFLLSVRVLSTVFRAKLLERLEGALEDGSLHTTRSCGLRLLRQANRKWVVYSKPPMAGPQQVLRYLGRYTHRIAIGNERLLSVENGDVTFRWKDRARKNRPSSITISGERFARRFLLHALPKRFVRVRHYGLLANAVRSDRLATARLRLDVPAPAEPSARPTESWKDLYLRLTGNDPTRCHSCRRGTLIVIAQLPRAPQPAARSP